MRVVRYDLINDLPSLDMNYIYPFLPGVFIVTRKTFHHCKFIFWTQDFTFNNVRVCVCTTCKTLDVSQHWLNLGQIKKRDYVYSHVKEMRE